MQYIHTALIETLLLTRQMMIGKKKKKTVQKEHDQKHSYK